MFRRFMREYGILTILILIVIFAFGIGYCIGSQKDKVPVFVEKPIVEEIEREKIIIKKYKEIKVTATAYCPCEKCCGKWGKNRPKDENGEPIVYTASGAIAKAGRTIAVDPSVIPYGTEVIINGKAFVAEDCGGAIKGSHIDIYFDTHKEALDFGKKDLTVYIEMEK